MLKQFLNFTEFFLFPIIHESQPSNLILEKNVLYGNSKDNEFCNFIYRKQSLDKSAKQPLLILIHGGGWVSGYKSLRNYYSYHAANQGYFVANIDYCLAPKQVFPYQIKQLFKAIDFVIDNADKYNIDTQRVVIAGESAGGYFALQLTAILKNQTLYDNLAIDFKHKDNFNVSAVISNCSAIDIVRLLDSNFPFMRTMVRCYTDKTKKELRKDKDKETIKMMSPTNYFTEDFPPTVIIYGAKDILRHESFALAKQFEELNVPHILYRGTGIMSLHASGIATKFKQAKRCFSATMDYVNNIVKP